MARLICKSEQLPIAATAGAKAREQASLTEVVESLKACTLFRDLSDMQIHTIATVFHVESYQPGEYIFKQGDIGDRVYVIEQGQVNLVRTVDLWKHEASVTVSLLKRCRLLGCWACLLDEYRHLTESAVCQKPTRVIMARGVDLTAILGKDLQLNAVMLKRLCLMLGDRIQDIYHVTASL